MHIDPDTARAAGFDRPILHGLCTMGVICHAAVEAVFAADPAALGHMECRFTAPVVPGDRISCEFWSVPEGWRFHASGGATAVAVGSLA